MITDVAGHVITSTRPTGGAGAWKVGRVSAVNRLLSCPDAHLCVSGWNGPHAASTHPLALSTNPAGGARSWRTISLPGSLLGFAALACPSDRFCAAVDSADDLITSADPAGGAAAWKSVNLGQGYNTIESVACPESALCVALDDEGNILTSASPGAANPAWTAAKVVPSRPGGLPVFLGLGSVSCPSSSFCAVAAGAQLFLSAAPADGVRAWSTRNLGVGQLQSVSCPSAQLCVVADATGHVLTATEPATGPWAPSMLGAPPSCGHAICGYDAITAVSCPSPSFCAATDGSNLWTSTHPTAGPADWQKSPLPATIRPPYAQLTCPSATSCVVASGTALDVTSDPGDPTPTWVPTGPPNLPPGTRFSGLACATIHACLAVDGNQGYAISGDPTAAGATWTASQIDAPASPMTPSSPFPPPSLTAAACARTGLCLARDGSGHAIAGQWSG